MTLAQAAQTRSAVTLATAPMTTILPVRDLARARRFYEDSLGLVVVGAKPDGKFLYRCGNGALLALFPKAEGTKAEHTAASFEVRDIAAVIAGLTMREKSPAGGLSPAIRCPFPASTPRGGRR